MDKLYFLECIDSVQKNAVVSGIGTLREKMLHAVLKEYFEPHKDSREVAVGGYVADIVGENGIIEIQSAGFGRLRKKLGELLEYSRVTVVYPIAHFKQIEFMDDNTGEIISRRKSPRTGNIYDSVPELFGIKALLKHDNFRFCIMLVDLTELRVREKKNRRGYSRVERIPYALHDEIHINKAEDWSVFIPPLDSEFTSADFAKSAKISRSLASETLGLLNYLGAVRRIGKSGNSFIYVRSSEGG